MKLFSFILCLLFMESIFGGVNDIIPTPQRIRPGTRELTIWENSRPAGIIVTGSNPAGKSRIAARYIVREVKKLTGGKGELKVISPDKLTQADLNLNMIFIGSPRENDGIKKCIGDYANLFTGEFKLTPEHPGPQGYVIQFAKTKHGKLSAVLAGSDPQGTLYAAMSFLYMLEHNNGRVFVKEASICDWPDFPVRWIGGAHNPDFLLKNKINMVSIGSYKGILKASLKKRREMRKVNEQLRKLGIRTAVRGHITMEIKPPKELKCRRGKSAYMSDHCLSDESLIKERAKRLRECIDAVRPGAVYLHDIDIAAGGLNGLAHRAWKTRCDKCRNKWPSDEMVSLQGSAGAAIETINSLSRTVRESPGGKDVLIYFVLPPYPLLSHSREQMREIAGYWNLISRHVPADVRLCAREICEPHVKMLVDSQAKQQPILLYTLSGQMKENFWALPVLSHMIKNYHPAKHPGQVDFFMALKCGDETPVQLLAAEYSWNSSQPGAKVFTAAENMYKYFKAPNWRIKALESPYISRVLLPRIDRALYGKGAGEITKFFLINPQIFQFDSALMLQRARGGKSFLYSLKNCGNLHFLKLANDFYPPIIKRYKQGYPHIDAAWKLIKNDATVSPRCKLLVFNWRAYTGMGRYAGEVLQNLSLSLYYANTGQHKKACVYMKLAQTAFVRLREFTASISAEPESKKMPGIYGNKPVPRFARKYQELLAGVRKKVQVAVSFAPVNSEIAVAKEKLKERDFAASAAALAHARQELGKLSQPTDKSFLHEYNNNHEKISAEIQNISKNIAWQRKMFPGTKVAVKPEKLLKVAVYDANADGGKSVGIKGIRGAYGKRDGIDMAVVDKLTPRNLAKYDVVILSGVNRIGSGDKKWRKHIRDYVSKGGGAIFTHHACGGRPPAHVYTITESVFPEIVKKIKQRSSQKTLTAVKDHPVTKDIKTNSPFKHGYSDHMQLIPGPEGTVVVRDPDPLAVMLIGENAAAGDNQGKAVVVTGTHGKGKVVFFGTLPGVNDANEESAPLYEEFLILRNAINWTGGK